MCFCRVPAAPSVSRTSAGDIDLDEQGRAGGKGLIRAWDIAALPSPAGVDFERVGLEGRDARRASGSGTEAMRCE